MRVIELYPVLAACLLASITGVTGVALPDGRPSFTLMRRQDDGEVEAESTEKLRKCMSSISRSMIMELMELISDYHRSRTETNLH